MRGTRSAAAFCLISLLTACPGAAEEPLAVIVNPERVTAMSWNVLAQIYLKKRRFWKVGEPIIPVNREAESWERALFAARVLGGAPSQLQPYWNDRYFHGVLPPATLASDEAVKLFVALDTHAIGYIRASLVDSSVRVVLYVSGE